MPDIFDFSWKRPSAGHEWNEVAGQKLLTARMGETDITYNPLKECTGLFREFADINPTAESILEFANEYGSLTPPIHLLGAKLHHIHEFSEGWGFSGRQTLEPFDLWAQEIQAMHNAVTLWDLASSGDRQRLRSYIRWSPKKDSVEFNGAEVPTLIAAANATMLGLALSNVFEELTPGDVVLPALVFVHRLVNEHLNEHVAISVPFDFNRNRLALSIRPDSLLTAMWLQFALAIEGNKKFRTCDTCGGWLEVRSKNTAHGAKAIRSNQKHCSETCKVKACRTRQYRLRERLQAGEPLQAIASDMKISLKTAKKWATGGKR